MTAYPAAMTTSRVEITDPKAKARSIRARLLRGFDLIQEAQAKGDQVKVATLQDFFDRLEVEYQEAKKAYAVTPEDLTRCPDCPHLGKGPLYDLDADWVVTCDSPCRDKG